MVKWWSTGSPGCSAIPTGLEILRAVDPFHKAALRFQKRKKQEVSKLKLVWHKSNEKARGILRAPAYPRGLHHFPTLDRGRPCARSVRCAKQPSSRFPRKNSANSAASGASIRKQLSPSGIRPNRFLTPLRSHWARRSAGGSWRGCPWCAASGRRGARVLAGKGSSAHTAWPARRGARRRCRTGRRCRP